MALLDRLLEYYGLTHSLHRYRAPAHTRRLTAMYARFIHPGDLCFDVGAHVGSRVCAWRRLGARVVVVEPQPLCLRVLRACHGRDPAVAVVDRALGAANGEHDLLVSRRSPGISTISAGWVERMRRRRDDFACERWDGAVRVRVTTLDRLIERFGEPAFVKIDVEGFEEPVLRGLSRPVPALSFESIPGATEDSLACLDRLDDLGPYELNVSPGEVGQFDFPGWVETERVAQWLASRPSDETPGDVYARLRDAAPSRGPDSRNRRVATMGRGAAMVARSFPRRAANGRFRP